MASKILKQEAKKEPITDPVTVSVTELYRMMSRIYLHAESRGIHQHETQIADGPDVAIEFIKEQYQKLIG